MRKILVSILVGVCAITMALGLAGCNDSHTHTYSSEYETNATHHWREAICDCSDAGVKDKAEHTYELNSENKMACSVCGKIQESISGGGGDEGEGEGEESNASEILPQIFNSLTNGLKLTGNVNFNDLTQENADVNGQIQSAVAFRDDSLLVDAILKSNVDEVFIVRGSKLYFTDGNESVEIADLSELSEKLGDLNLIPLNGQNSPFTTILTEVVKALPKLLSDTTIFEVYDTLYQNTLSYLSITTEEIPNSTDSVTTVDFKQTVIDLLTDVKALATYIDINHPTKTVSDLYESEEFKTLVLPALENITGAQIETILNNLLPLAKTFLLPNGYELEFDIPKAGETTAYEYLASLLQTTITIEDFSITLGTMPLSALVGDAYETPGYSLTNEIQQAIAEVDSTLNSLKLSFTYTSQDEDYLIKGIDFIYDVNSYYEGDYGVIEINNTNAISVDFIYNDDTYLDQIAIYYVATENSSKYTDTTVTISFEEDDNSSAIVLSSVTTDYNEFGAPFYVANAYIKLQLASIEEENKDALILSVLITEDSVTTFELSSSFNVYYADEYGTMVDKVEFLVDANDGEFLLGAVLDLEYQEDTLVSAVLDIDVKENNLFVFTFDGSLELAYSGDNISKFDLDVLVSNDGVNPIFEAGILAELAYANNKLSILKLTLEGFNQKLEIISTIAYANASSNLITSITLDVNLNDLDLIDGALAINYNSNNQITKVALNLKDSTAEKMLFGIDFDMETTFSYDSDNALSEINSQLNLTSVAFELACDLKLELLKEEYTFVEITEEVA